MFEDPYPVQWTGRQAVVALPGHMDLTNASQIGEELLSLVNRGATALIADMSGTESCDHAGLDAVMRAYQRAAANGAQLRLVVTSPVVWRVLSSTGLDRLVSIYPSLEAASAAGLPVGLVAMTPRPGIAGAHLQPGSANRAQHRRPAGPRRPAGTAAITQAVLRRTIDAVADGVALIDEPGVLALGNRRLEEMFGYRHTELTGQPVDHLLPADLRAAHRAHRATYARAPAARPMGAGARLVALRKDGTTFPVQVSLSPVPTATGHLTLAVVRDAAGTEQREDLLDLARATVAVDHAQPWQDLFDRIVSGLFDVGLCLEAAVGLPRHVARQRISEALQHLDEAIYEIRATSSSFGADKPAPPRPATRLHPAAVREPAAGPALSHAPQSGLAARAREPTSGPLPSPAAAARPLPVKAARELRTSGSGRPKRRWRRGRQRARTTDPPRC
jgi:anti-anti-sigma factor